MLCKSTVRFLFKESVGYYEVILFAELEKAFTKSMLSNDGNPVAVFIAYVHF